MHFSFTGDQCFKTSGPGPHPASCQRIWWLNAGCSMRGSAAPHQPNDYWNSFDVAHVQYDMGLYYQLGIDGDAGYYMACLGTPLFI